LFGLLQRWAARRNSQSDIPFGFSQLSPPLPPPMPVKHEAPTGPDGGGGDDAALYDLVNTYMDLDGMDALHPLLPRASPYSIPGYIHASADTDLLRGLHLRSLLHQIWSPGYISASSLRKVCYMHHYAHFLLFL
jgi:hypothetical protein